MKRILISLAALLLAGGAVMAITGTESRFQDMQVKMLQLNVGDGTATVATGDNDAYIEGDLEIDGTFNPDGALTVDGAVTASADVTILTPGDLIIGNGTPSVTQNGEDAYVEGTFEVDGASEFDGAVDMDSTITIGTTAINTATLTSMARGFFTVCGDIITVASNTVYYGPSSALVDSATAGDVTCNTDATGSTTEATADEPAITTTAFYPLGMVCYSTDMGATGSPLTYTLRSAEAAITPAISTSIADNILSGAVNVTATTAVASAATVAVALTSAGDVGAGAFMCRISYAF